jgi:hypothetical protein
MGGELVVIGGREFELGAVYAPRSRSGRQLRRLVAYAPAEGWRGGRVETLIIGRTTRRPSACDVVSGAWWARWAGERVAGPSPEAGSGMMDDDELEAQTRAATDAVRATVMRLLREDGIHPQLVVLAVTRVAGELGADIAHMGGAGPGAILSDLADLVRHAGQVQHEKLEAETMPTAGSA